jgi:hypothetical protein
METSIACRGFPYPQSSNSRIAAIRAVSLFAFSAQRPRALHMGHDVPGFCGLGFMAYRKKNTLRLA